MRHKSLQAVLGAVLLGSAVGIAQAESGFYVGANYGQASIDLCSDLAVTGCDDDDHGWKAYGGFDFNQYLAVEAGYADFGSFSVLSSGSLFVGDYDGAFVDVKGTLPFSPQFGVFAKLGRLFWDVEGSNASAGYDADGDDMSYGLGADYMFTEQFGARLEWQEFQDVDGDDVEFWSGGALFKF